MSVPLRVCRTCGRKAKTEDDLELFTKDSECRYGRDNWCRKCGVEYQRERARNLRDKLNRLKDKPCTDCGGSFPPECMDFDHVRGEKHFAVGATFGRYGWKAVLKEIEKCDLVCANCHRIRTHKRRL